MVAVGIVALAAVVVVLVLLLFPRGDGQIDLGNVADYQPGSVVYRSTDRFFVVRLPDGSMLALSDVDPHNPQGRASCRVTFRPDLAMEGESGRFFDSCTGSMYDIAGRALSGDGLNLETVPLEQDEDGDLRARPVDG